MSEVLLFTLLHRIAAADIDAAAEAEGLSSCVRGSMVKSALPLHGRSVFTIERPSRFSSNACTVEPVPPLLIAQRKHLSLWYGHVAHEFASAIAECRRGTSVTVDAHGSDDWFIFGPVAPHEVFDGCYVRPLSNAEIALAVLEMRPMTQSEEAEVERRERRRLMASADELDAGETFCGLDSGENSGKYRVEVSHNDKESGICLEGQCQPFVECQKYYGEQAEATALTKLKTRTSSEKYDSQECHLRRGESGDAEKTVCCETSGDPSAAWQILYKKSKVVVAAVKAAKIIQKIAKTAFEKGKESLDKGAEITAGLATKIALKRFGIPKSAYEICKGDRRDTEMIRTLMRECKGDRGNDKFIINCVEKVCASEAQELISTMMVVR